ncbi:M4 family metallopeptidase [Geodermatophilus sp. URMC 63]
MPGTPLSVFVSYAHEDEAHRAALSTQLSLLRRSGLIREWHDRQLEAGQRWREEILAELTAADIILLLVSPDFIASDFAWGEEVSHTMSREAEGTARVIPIIVRPVDWQSAPFGRLQALPRDAKPVTLWRNRDAAWLAVAEGIKTTAEELVEGSAPEPRPRTKVSSRGGKPRRSPPPGPPPSSSARRRAVHDAAGSSAIPGALARAEGDPPTGDPIVDETFEAIGSTQDFFHNVFGRASLDGRDHDLTAVVHYRHGWNNTAWNGQLLLVGDGDGRLFTRFSGCLEVLAHELSHAVIESSTKLTFWGESGAICESIADVFGVLVRQYRLGQTAVEADWLLGAGLLADGVNGVALRSLSSPGTAYDDPLLGKDPQPRHLRDIVSSQEDNGGVHVNSGIPSRAFYLTATALGGHSWERAGRIWYETVVDPRLRPDVGFREFYQLTWDKARELYGDASDEALAVEYGWRLVGVA